jgi:phosphatidylserine/phosphatidylglycerophosphate/cardiolipin synthase-like enzyme
MLVQEAGALEAAADLGSLELVNRRCILEDQDPIKIKNVPSFNIAGEFIAYASPDSTYAVTKQLLDAAKRTILIGIYDFTADYMKTILLNAMSHRGVKVSVMVDLDGAKGELPIFENLKKFGSEAVPAPSCASENVHFFRSSHEKVIVVDGEWTLVQSGNYSPSSIPFNEKDGGDPNNFVKGNRDMGVAVRSKPLAAFFTKVLRADMKLETDASLEAVTGRKARRAKSIEMVEAVPKLIPTELFPSKHFNPDKPIKVTPVLSPDNYMKVVPEFLAAARKSILIEQQYIHSQDTAINQLLSAIRTAMDKNPDLDVRIILGKIFGGAKGVEKERDNQANIRKKFGLQLGQNIRFIDTKRFIHCHNKLILVDNEAVLVSSQNWSNPAVLENREAGLLMRFPLIARYYAKIFESDWSTAIKSLPKKAEPDSVGPESLASGKFIEVNFGDYVHL